ncbi:MAG: CRISPR-associated endonuclease Cas2 [Alloprevotella sp.]|nr:CRISPR-associated endonuclease Cas2 [Alloprevotella sp.]
MFLYVYFRFPVHARTGREQQKQFCKLLERAGFSRLHQGLYIRHCFTQAGAAAHKERILEIIPSKCQISIIFVPDKQQSYSYHYWGIKRIKKASDDSLKAKGTIEFI